MTGPTNRNYCCRHIKKHEKEWRKMQPYIIHLYPIVKLKALQTKLRTDHGFIASERQYTHRFEKLGITKYQTHTTLAKEYAVNPHTVLPPYDLPLLYAAEFLQTTAHPAAYPVYATLLHPYLSPQAQAQKHSPSQSQLQPTDNDPRHDRPVLQGFGIAIQHLGIPVAFASAANTAHIHLGHIEDTGPSTLWQSLTKSTHDAEKHFSPLTKTLLETLIATGDPSRVSEVVREYSVHMATESEFSYGSIDIVTYILVHNMVLTITGSPAKRVNDAGSTSILTPDTLVLAKLTHDLLARQPLITQNPQKINTHRQIIDSCLTWCQDILHSYLTLHKTPPGLYSLLNSDDVIKVKAALYCLLWDTWFQRQIKESTEVSSSRSSYSPSPSPSPSTLDHSLPADRCPPNWSHASYYYLGIPPATFLAIIIDICLDKFSPINLSAASLYSEVPRGIQAMHDQVMRYRHPEFPLADIWEAFIDGALYRMMPNRERLMKEKKVWGFLRGYLETVVPQVREVNLVMKFDH